MALEAGIEEAPARYSKSLAVRLPKARHSMKTSYIGLTICAILCALIGAIYLVFDPLVKHIILQRLVLTNNSDIADVWENPPITPHLKVYFFNLTNAEEFFSGKGRPILQEVGPYTYHQKWIKENVTWHGNGTMSYQTRKEFKFVPELSSGHHETDIICTANVPVISAYFQMRKASYWTKYAVNFAISSLGYSGWIKKTAEELIWGYEETLFDLAALTMDNPPELEKFGLFTKKNATTNLATYTMFTGETNPYNLSKISMVNGQSSLNKWSDPQCNIVQGSDGATFNPYIQKSDTLWFFNEELCRSLPLVFDREVTHAGSLTGFRFTPRSDVFMTPRSHPENACFCDGAEKDLCEMIGDGMFAISSCQFDAPIILSWPHFLHANQSYIDSIDGLRPEAEKHSFYFEVQPTTGTTLSAKARVQINLAVMKNDDFTAVSQVEDTILPLCWFEEGLDELGPELTNVISQAVVNPPVYKNYILCILVGLGTATAVITAITFTQYCMNRCRRDRHQRLLANQTMVQNEDTFHVLGEEKFAKVRHIIHTSYTGPKLPEIMRHASCGCPGNTGDSYCSLHKPMLSSEASSTESSRLTSANHSRNSSTGSTPPFVNNAEEEVENRKSLLDPETKLPNVA